MNKIWIISDTHFNHPAIRKYCNRPDDCDSLMRLYMRRMIADDDILIHLGDVIFDNPTSLKEMLAQYKFTKILVRGNHDSKSDNWYLDNGFDLVTNMLQIKDVIFTHIPIDMNAYFFQQNNIKYNVHGHLHNTDYRKIQPNVSKIYDETKNILYSPELRGYKPVLLDHLIKEVIK